MNKLKLAICMKDLEYQTRFVNCFMNHYNHQYELHVFTSLEQLEHTNPKEYAVIITGEYTTEEMTNFVKREEIILSLAEKIGETNNALEENLFYTEKYQEVYKIAEVIERLVADQIPSYGASVKAISNEILGVYSLTQEMYQVPITALLGKIYGEQQKVVVLDLQQYSGFSEVEEGMTSMGLEDLLSVATTGNYSKSRVLECIRHEANWDYICAVHNNQCLAEGTKELYVAMLDYLGQELGYQKVIINFGSVFLGQLELMEECQRLYLLSEKDAGKWREEVFFHELSRLGKESLLQRIKKIEIPTTSSRENKWRILVEKWNWGQIGELLRQGLEKENPYGAAV